MEEVDCNGGDDGKNPDPDEGWKCWILLGVLAEYEVPWVTKGELNRAFFEGVGCMMLYKFNGSDI